MMGKAQQAVSQMAGRMTGHGDQAQPTGQQVPQDAGQMAGQAMDQAGQMGGQSMDQAGQMGQG
jgi:hypothetical protein